MSHQSTSESVQRAVTNATCLVGLERIGRLDILPQVFPVILTPPAVQTEVGITADWLTVQAAQDLTTVAVLKTQVDIGEAEAIALALELEAGVIILDDRKARRLAEQLGFGNFGRFQMRFIQLFLLVVRFYTFATLRPWSKINRSIIALTCSGTSRDKKCPEPTAFALTSCGHSSANRSRLASR